MTGAGLAANFFAPAIPQPVTPSTNPTDTKLAMRGMSGSTTADLAAYSRLVPTPQFTPCGFAPTGPHLIVAIPKATGDYEMGPMRNMTFVSDNDNKISFDGRIVVDTATPTTVSGGLVASFDGDNEVNGTFEVTVCPGQ